VQPNSELSINAVEGFPLEDFSAENVRSQISEAQKIAGGSGSEQDIAEAKIELEVIWQCVLVLISANTCIGSGELAGCSEVNGQSGRRSRREGYRSSSHVHHCFVNASYKTAHRN
jgi:hypothetical protein